MVELPDLLDNIPLVLLSQFRIDGKGQRIARGTFCLWEIAASVTKITKAILAMQRNRIIDLRLYAFFTQEKLEPVSISKPADKLIVYVSCRVIWRRNTVGQPQVFEQGSIPVSITTARFRPAFEILQFHSQNCRLKRV